MTFEEAQIGQVVQLENTEDYGIIVEILDRDGIRIYWFTWSFQELPSAISHYENFRGRKLDEIIRL